MGQILCLSPLFLSQFYSFLITFSFITHLSRKKRPVWVCLVWFGVVFLFCFVFWLSLRHVEVSKSGIKSTPQQQPGAPAVTIPGPSPTELPGNSFIDIQAMTMFQVFYKSNPGQVSLTAKSLRVGTITFVFLSTFTQGNTY